MPKIKTHKGMSKRIRKTKTGKIKRRSAYISHLLEKRSSKRKRSHQGVKSVSKGDQKRILRLVP